MTLVEACRVSLGVEADEAWQLAVDTHLSLLQRWAPKMNLSTVSEPAEAMVRHVLDSLALLKLRRVREATGPLLDVGSGAGFPGIPLAAALPAADVTLLEPRQKRGVFLNRVLAEAGIRNARWLEGRLPDARLNQRFHLVVSRATLSPDELIEAARPTLAPGGAVAVMAATSPWDGAPHGWNLLQSEAFALDGAARWVGVLAPT